LALGFAERQVRDPATNNTRALLLEEEHLKQAQTGQSPLGTGGKHIA
jgi:hypothetical protein